MKTPGRILAVGLICFVAATAAAWLSPIAAVRGQEKSKSTKKSGKAGKSRPQANTKNLDIKADQLASSFTRDAEELAGQYAEAGHLDKARAILESALAVNPQSANIQKKLEQVKEGIMNANDYEVDVNPARGWEPSGAMVVENRPLRIRAEGTYRFDSGGSLTAAGFPVSEPATDMAWGIPCGALMGVIVDGAKSGRPFLIGESLDFTPKEAGMLMLRVNAPKANKNSGKIKVSISGFIQTKHTHVAPD
jgi:hypothetical protein